MGAMVSAPIRSMEEALRNNWMAREKRYDILGAEKADGSLAEPWHWVE
jgi:hypothetical protein